MKKLLALILIAAPAAIVACGDDGEGGDGPTPDLETACEAYCDASYRTPCGQSTADQCKTQCPFLEQSLDGICVEEYAEALDCASSLQYTCSADGVPVPQQSGSACVGEAQSLLACVQDAPCLRFCRAAAEAGCAGGSEGTCVSSCTAERAQNESCDFDFDRLRDCQGRSTLTCVEGQPVSDACAQEQADYDMCVAQGF